MAHPDGWVERVSLEARSTLVCLLVREVPDNDQSDHSS